MSENTEKKPPSVFSPYNTNTRIRAINCVKELPELDKVFSSVLAGSVASIVAPGSTGKGFFSLGVCFDLFTGKDLLGLDIKPLEASQKVAFVTAEDQADVVAHRVHSLIKHYNMTPDDVCLMDEQISFISIVGERMLDLVRPDGSPNLALADEMIEQYRGYRLVFLDTLARAHQSNENDNGNMTVLISVFEYIAKHTGAAFVFLHHTNKGATLNNQGDAAGAARGAAAITDNIRCQLNLSKITEEDAAAIGRTVERHNYIWLHSSKVNYSKSNPDMLLERSESGCLTAVKNSRSFDFNDAGEYGNG